MHWGDGTGAGLPGCGAKPASISATLEGFVKQGMFLVDTSFPKTVQRIFGKVKKLMVTIGLLTGKAYGQDSAQVKYIDSLVISFIFSQVVASVLSKKIASKIRRSHSFLSANYRRQSL